MSSKYKKILVCDLETNNEPNNCFVWCSAVVPLYGSENDIIFFQNISQTFNYLKSLRCDVLIYYHNLKFDGSFWLYYLLKKGFKLGILGELGSCKWKPDKYLKNGEIKYFINGQGQWYKLKFKYYNHVIELRDSAKLLPFSIKKLGEEFDTKHKKLDLEYSAARSKDHVLSDEEKKYVANDVLVLKEALEIMYNKGYTNLTIGSCCLKEFKRLCWGFDKLFPPIHKMALDKEIYGSSDIDGYIRKSYKGGWCYGRKENFNKKFTNGVVLDVNSLYGYVQHSISGNRYPVGVPKFWKGNFIPDIALKEEFYFFVRIRTRFYLKKNFLPFIQIRGSWFYDPQEMLESTDIKSLKTSQTSPYKYLNGNAIPNTVELTLTQTDYSLFLKHYNVEDFEILDGCFFHTEIGIFDNYLNKYMKIKETSSGAQRTIAKLFIVNLYGKFATNRNSSFKVNILEDKLKYITNWEKEKTPVYIPVGAAITSYARCFTISNAQKNYKHFLYSDTDSLHLNIPLTKVKGFPIDDNKLGYWKVENEFAEAIYLRSKCYINKIRLPNGKYKFKITCAGMSDRCKLLLRYVLGDEEVQLHQLPQDLFNNPEIVDFLSKKISIEDFTYGLKVPGKLLAKNVENGIVLIDTTFELRPTAKLKFAKDFDR